MNRPAPGLPFHQMLGGLATFHQEYDGQHWLEVFLLGGATDVDAEVEAIAAGVRRISPDSVQLNTVTRPPAGYSGYSVPPNELARLAPRIAASAELIADCRHVHGQPAFAARAEDVFELLRRRPCAVEDIAPGLGVHCNEATKHVEQFLAEKRINSSRGSHQTYHLVRE